MVLACAVVKVGLQSKDRCSRAGSIAGSWTCHRSAIMDKLLWGCNLIFEQKNYLCIVPAHESSQWIGVGSFSSTQTEKGGQDFNVYFFLLRAIWENDGKVRLIVAFLAPPQ